MKILHINDYLELVGGAEKVMYDVKHLLESNHIEVDVWGGNDKVITHSINSLFNIKYFIRLRKFLKTKEYDCIHIHKFSSILSSSIFLAIPKKTKVILHVHDFGFYCYKLGIRKDSSVCIGGLFHNKCISHSHRVFEILFNFIKRLRFILNRIIIKNYVDIFLCPSKILQTYMLKTLNLPGRKVVYLPNFIEANNVYYPNFNHIDDNKFLYVGRLSKEKGVDIIIRAFDRIVNHIGILSINLEIVGDGPEKNTLEHLVKSLNLKNHIKFLGKIENNKLGSYYESALGLIMPSVCLENNPLVAIEGMKFGKPIIASNIGGYPDLVEDGKTGYLFETGNVLDLADKIQCMYKDKKLSIQMGKFGFDKMKSDFSNKLFLKRLLDIYKN